MTLQLIYITAKDQAQAEMMGRTLVEEQLAACVNILSPMTSIYKWEGKITKESEAVLLVKTEKGLFDAVKKRVAELHSYEIPCIIGIDISDINKDYGDWLNKQLR